MPLGNQPRPAHAVPLSGLTSGRRGRGGKHFVMQGHGHSMHQQRAPAGVLGVLWQVVHGHCVELACFCDWGVNLRSRSYPYQKTMIKSSFSPLGGCHGKTMINHRFLSPFWWLSCNKHSISLDNNGLCTVVYKQNSRSYLLSLRSVGPQFALVS